MNPIRRIKTKAKEYFAARERFYDEDPLGKQIAAHLSKWREIIRDVICLFFNLVRARLRGYLRKYLNDLQKEYPKA
ncbi:unnamed protein product [Hymenolepis diminuta]|uniref:Tnp_DDE_dom domain-containing protein n=1 Tax=Hymenolepis diminuta TaxID=6216 RepID=A0A0R3SIA3_HYMDI|nr:unnamed protein product [Hymenolepis diminuta]